MSNIGVPIKLLHEAQGHTVTCELKTGEVIYLKEKNKKNVIQNIQILNLYFKIRSTVVY